MGQVGREYAMNEASDMRGTTCYGRPLSVEAEKKGTGSNMNHPETRGLCVCALRDYIRIFERKFSMRRAFAADI